MTRNDDDGQRARIKQHLDRGDATGWFEIVYAGAEGEGDRVPWACQAARPAFDSWLRTHDISGNGRRALVVGCGLGDDAEELARRGFEVTAFDVSPSAIAWCKRRFPDSDVHYEVADLFAAPAAWRHAYEFVLEIFTVQALPIMMREQTIAAISDMVAPDGTLLVFCLGHDEAEGRTGPPWPLTRSELDHFLEHGLAEVQLDEMRDEPSSVGCRFRVEYRRTT
jgi:2-polyprenyl-3-methyl-5-hydroxy-6-metoxy-1,4-benzoquinol methylase